MKNFYLGLFVHFLIACSGPIHSSSIQNDEVPITKSLESEFVGENIFQLFGVKEKPEELEQLLLDAKGARIVLFKKGAPLAHLGYDTENDMLFAALLTDDLESWPLSLGFDDKFGVRSLSVISIPILRVALAKFDQKSPFIQRLVSKIGTFGPEDIKAFDSEKQRHPNERDSKLDFAKTWESSKPIPVLKTYDQLPIGMEKFVADVDMNEFAVVSKSNSEKISVLSTDGAGPCVIVALIFQHKDLVVASISHKPGFVKGAKLIQMYEDHFAKVQSEMRAQSIQITKEEFSSAIQGYVVPGNPTTALQIFRTLRSLGIKNITVSKYPKKTVWTGAWIDLKGSIWISGSDTYDGVVDTDKHTLHAFDGKVSFDPYDN